MSVEDNRMWNEQDAVIIPCDGRQKWLEIFSDLKHTGKSISPRGQRTLEIENYHIDVHPINDRFCSFSERDLSLRYLAAEFAWYLGADPNDRFIEVMAPFWGSIKNENRPYWNSNYGVPFFHQGQFDRCVEALERDSHTRQACVVINRADVMHGSSMDRICTNAVMFRIRGGVFSMTVQMRSNDVIFGLCYDLPMFSFIMEMMHTRLLKTYPTLEIGSYHHTAVSFHIYERHFEMMESILANNGANYKVLRVPRIRSDNEVDLLLSHYPVWLKSAIVKRDARHIGAFPFTNRLLKWAAMNKNP